MYDATIATWESKYFYNRPRPSELDHTLSTALPVPNSPSYPSEHAAAAQAAAAVLAYFLPAEAKSFQTMAEQAGWSRVLAGLQYPSDYYAGLALGRSVAEQVIAKAKADGSDAVWTGTVPTGPCKWIGTNPGNVTAANWKPLLLSAPSQFRPAPPPACDSPEVLAEDGGGSQLSPNLRDQLQSVLLAKPGRSQDLALSVRGQVDLRRPARSESASRRAGLRADRSGAVRLPSSPARTASSPTGTSGRLSSIRPSYRCSRFPTSRVTLRTTRRSRPLGPRSWRTCSRRMPISFAPLARRPATREFGLAFTSRWTTSQECSLGGPSPKFSSRGRRTMVHSKSTIAITIMVTVMTAIAMMIRSRSYHVRS